MDTMDNRFKSLEAPRRTGYLVGGFITDTLTVEEREELDAWVLEKPENMQLFEDLTAEGNLHEFMRWLARTDTENALLAVRRRIRERKRAKLLRWVGYAAAACAVGVLGYFVYDAFKSRTMEPMAEPVAPMPPVMQPGSAQAVLQLGDGRQVLLAGRDTVVDGIRVSGGVIAYSEASVEEADIRFHELRIPRKGYYQLALPDGSVAFLNSASSIRYPSRFSGEVREVEVSGEVYIQVKPDVLHRFVVQAGNRRIEALGTAFNVNGFDEKITLVEGKVKVSEEGKEWVLKPGEQLSAAGSVQRVSLAAVVAWTRQEFKFEDETLATIMPRLERWYDFKAEFRSPVKGHFNGTIDRNVPLGEVLKYLEATGQVKFEVTGQTVFINHP